jgi:predicted DNA-binding protein
VIMIPKPKNKAMAVSLPPDLIEQVRAEAERVGQTISGLVRIYIQAGLGREIVNGEVKQ